MGNYNEALDSEKKNLSHLVEAISIRSRQQQYQRRSTKRFCWSESRTTQPLHSSSYSYCSYCSAVQVQRFEAKENRISMGN